MPVKPKLPKGFVAKSVKLPDGQERKYTVFVPPQYVLHKKKKWPVVVFLHGSGECGKDGVKQTTVGLPTLLAADPAKYPFIVVMPQAADLWYRGDNAVAVWMALDEVLKKYRTNRDRIYLTGLSMGGFGTWELAVTRPDVFAAIVPICGLAPTEFLPNIVHLPVWAFHGAADPNVPVKGSRDAVAELKRLGAKPKYTEYPGVGHNCWDAAYRTKKLWSWLLEKRRAPAPRVIDYKFPGGGSRVWWLEVEAEEGLKTPAQIHAEIGEDGSVTVDSKGVAAWAIGAESCPLKAGQRITVTWNGKGIYAGDFAGTFETPAPEKP